VHNQASSLPSFPINGSKHLPKFLSPTTSLQVKFT